MPPAGSLDGLGALEHDAVASLVRLHLPWAVASGPFAVHYFATHESPRQGWKLHVSATPWSAGRVLEACLPILFEAGVSFKVASSGAQVLLLNNGLYGQSQVGKFLTVYPADDDQALRIARALHAATSHLPGPRVPRERSILPGSLIHYRYGAFQQPPRRPDDEPQDSIGSLIDEAGRSVVDDRDSVAPPAIHGIADPFLALRAPADARTRPLAARFLVLGILSESAGSAVYRAIDLDAAPAELCVVKVFWRHGGGDIHGRLAPDWGRHEAALLRRHHDEPALPRLIDEFEQDGDVYVVVEYIEGATLAQELERREAERDLFTMQEVLSLGADLSAALERVHRHGIVMRDLNPANTVRAETGWRLIDFGISFDHFPGAGPPQGLGTADFCSPQQWAEAPPRVTDDIFSWGALMYRVLAGPDEPSSGAPGPQPRRALRERRPDLPDDLVDLVEAAIAWREEDRVADAAELSRRLRVIRHVGSMGSLGARPDGDPPRAPAHDVDGVLTRANALRHATAVGRELCAAAIERDGGVCWAATGRAGPFCSPDVYHGAAGIALFLGRLAMETDDPDFRATAEAALRWVCGPVWSRGRAEPGLHCGESGVGFVLVQIAEAWNRPSYLTAADLRARRLRDVSYQSPALVDGIAGHALFLATLANATGEARHREEAIRVADHLLDRSIETTGRRLWVTARGGSAQAMHLGLAHGAAGIGVALLAVAAATNDDRFASEAHRLGDLLLAAARRDDANGWTWPETLSSEKARIQAQCHGAVGIGQFLLRLNTVYPDEGYAEAARAAALTARRLMPERPSSSICHGIAGDGIFLEECAPLLPDAALRPGVADALALIRERGDRGELPAFRASPELFTGSAGEGWLALSAAVDGGLGDPVLPTAHDKTAADKTAAALPTG